MAREDSKALRSEKSFDAYFGREGGLVGSGEWGLGIGGGEGWRGGVL